MSDEIERVASQDDAQDAEDFEGHKLEEKIAARVEDDFEGHKFELKIEEKVADKVSDV